MMLKIFLSLTLMIGLAGCQGQPPPAPTPNPEPVEHDRACNTDELNNRIKTLEAEKETLEAMNKQLQTGTQLTDKEKVETLLGLCQRPKSVLLQVSCALTTQVMLQNCGITDHGDGTYTFTPPTMACPCPFKRVLTGEEC